MTYIVGLNLFGGTALIADTCVTTTSQSTTSVKIDGGIKTGYLFPHGGAIYAFSGFIAPATEFIGNVKRHLSHLRFKDDLKHAWNEFREFVIKYRFPSKGFQMLISTRHTGIPQLYLLTSTTSSLDQCTEQLVTLGSGKDLVDDGLKEIFPLQVDWSLRAHTEGGGQLLDYPYVFCLRLMELTCGAEYKSLRKHGVGGFFHFITQHADREFRQLPSIYVIVRVIPQAKIIASMMYHVLFAAPPSPVTGEPPGDVLITRTPNSLKHAPQLPGNLTSVAQSIAKSSRRGVIHDTTVYFDTAVWPTVAMLQRHELEGIANTAVSIANSTHPHFLGVGFADPQFRPAHMGILSKDLGGLSDACDSSGETRSSVMNFIAGVCGIDPNMLAADS